MRPQYIKPENAIQRAEELLEVNAPAEALGLLQETLLARRSRGAPITSLEPLAIKLLELAVDLRRNKVAREALHSYKNLAQNTSVPSVEKVVRHFLEVAEVKLRDAEAAAEARKAQSAPSAPAAKQAIPAPEDENADDIDLETPDTFESIFASVIGALDESDAVNARAPASAPKPTRREKNEVTPRLKFLWDAYRTVLDVLRNNARLELLYQQTVARAFAFCVRYKRKSEFRRLCDTLRIHLANIPRQANQSQTYAINLSDPDVLQRFLDTRFLQLQTATDLELFQEGFKSAEDIYSLLVLAGNLITNQTSQSAAHIPMAGLLPAALFAHKRHGTKMMHMVAQYYLKLTKIFNCHGPDALFHASSWNKYFGWILNMKGAATLTEEENKQAASHVLLSALAVPVFTEPVDPDLPVHRFNRKTRLAVLLGMTAAPERAHLLADAASKPVLSRVPSAVRDLYEALEVDFHPLTAASRIKAALVELEKIPHLAQYVVPIRTVAAAKILRMISGLYSNMSFESMFEMLSFLVAGSKSLFTLESLIMQGNAAGEFNIKLNHISRTLEFSNPAPLVRRSTKSDPLGALRTLPLFTHWIEQEKQHVMQEARDHMEEEHKQAIERQHIIESKKEEIEQAAKRKAKEEAEERARRMNAEREALQKKLAEEARQREMERLKREQEEIRKQEARKIAEALKAKSGVTIADKDLDEMDTTAIFALQAEQIKTEKEAQEAKMRAFAKKIDFMERAIRKEEIPLLEKAREEQKVADREAFEEARRRAVHEAKERHATSVTIKHRVLRMKADYESYRDQLAEAHAAQIAQERAEAERRIAAAKQQRREQVKEMIQRAIRAEKEAEERKAREAEEEAERLRIQEEQEEEERRLREQEAEAAAAAAEKDRLLPQRDLAPVGPARSDGAWTPRAAAAGPTANGPQGWTPKNRLPGAGAAAPAAGPAAGWRPSGVATANPDSGAGTAPSWRSSGSPAERPGAFGPRRTMDDESSSDRGSYHPPLSREGSDRGSYRPPLSREGSDRGTYRPPTLRGDAPEPYRPVGARSAASSAFGGMRRGDDEDRPAPPGGAWRPGGSSAAGGSGDGAWKPRPRQ